MRMIQSWHMVKRRAEEPGEKEVKYRFTFHRRGKLDQPYQTLVAFAKTAELEPEKTRGSETFSFRETAGYNEEKKYRPERRLHSPRGNSSRTLLRSVLSRWQMMPITNKVRNGLGKPEYIEEIRLIPATFVVPVFGGSPSRRRTTRKL